MEQGIYKIKRPNQYTFLRRVWYWFTRTNVYAFIVRALKLFFMGSLGTILVLAGVMIDRSSTPAHVSADAVENNELPPILKKIAQAESYNSHYCTIEIVKKHGCKSYEVGAVLYHVNTNGTIDVGKYAINSVHFATAVKMNLDVWDEEDNETFARHLFNTQGSEPWYASRKNWK